MLFLFRFATVVILCWSRVSYWGLVGFLSHVSILHSFCRARSQPQDLCLTIVLISTGYFDQNCVGDPFSFLVNRKPFNFKERTPTVLISTLYHYFFSTSQLKMLESNFSGYIKLRRWTAIIINQSLTEIKDVGESTDNHQRQFSLMMELVTLFVSNWELFV